VDRVSFTLSSGRSVGLVGESGCGKTTTAKAIAGLLPKNAAITSGNIEWNGQDISSYSEEQYAGIRWKEIALIPQSAMNSLDPVYRLGDQIVEAIRTHETVSQKGAWKRAEQLCRLVNVEPKRLLDYPHQLSGGMKQRLVIAMALALRPRLIIADEPTTALDVMVQARILRQIKNLQREFAFAMTYISHDIAVIAETCHDVVIMYAGQIVEYGPIRTVLKSPAHPYTMGLENAFPDIHNAKALISIPGHPPKLNPPPPGCRFASRCPFVIDRCRQEEPPLVEVLPGQFAACFYADQAASLRQRARRPETWQQQSAIDRVAS
jgi:oligopeptide/dipeptide ABC transporter ATP-binding protein